MNSSYINKRKAEIIAIGQEMWSLGLVTGWNGNISVKVEDRVLLTATGTSLGRLTEENISLIDMQGRVIDGKEPSSEYRLHLDIYNNIDNVETIVHTHTVFTNAFFLERELFQSSTFEGEWVLGQVFGVEQASINVEVTGPVVERLRGNQIVALRRHGVVSVGNDLFDCMARIQVLEEQIKLEGVRKLFR